MQVLGTLKTPAFVAKLQKERDRKAPTQGFPLKIKTLPKVQTEDLNDTVAKHLDRQGVATGLPLLPGTAEDTGLFYEQHGQGQMTSGMFRIRFLRCTLRCGRPMYDLRNGKAGPLSLM